MFPRHAGPPAGGSFVVLCQLSPRPFYFQLASEAPYRLVYVSVVVLGCIALFALPTAVFPGGAVVVVDVLIVGAPSSRALSVVAAVSSDCLLAVAAIPHVCVGAGLAAVGMCGAAGVRVGGPWAVFVCAACWGGFPLPARLSAFVPVETFRGGRGGVYCVPRGVPRGGCRLRLSCPSRRRCAELRSRLIRAYSGWGRVSSGPVGLVPRGRVLVSRWGHDLAHAFPLLVFA